MPSYIGRSMHRREDERLILGQGHYTDDIHLEHEVHAAFVRSPFPHAIVTAVDTRAAQAAPGVLAVYTARDYIDDGHARMAHVPMPADAIDPKQPAFTAMPDGPPIRIVRPYPLVDERVRHVGEAVAMVIALSAAAARDAAELVEVSYDDLPAVTDARAALAQNAPQLWDDVPGNLCLQAHFGDVDATARALSSAHLIVSGTFRNQRIAGAQMEPRAAIGTYDDETGYGLICGSQGVSRHRTWIAETLAVAPERVHVRCPDVGGSFGIRQFLHPEELLVVWAAKRVGRPVRWTGDRSEDFLGDFQGRDIIVDGTMGLDANGQIVGLRLAVDGNVGAFTVNFAPMQNYQRIATTVYAVPSVDVLVRGALTNTPPTVPFRGAGRPEATFTIERLLDMAATRLGLDRREIRTRNLIAQSALPYRSPMGLTYDSGAFRANMERACTLADWDGFPARREESAQRGLLRGIGVANYVEAPVGAPRERVRIHVRPNDRIDIVAGTQSSGQGHETSFAQVVAELLDLPFTSVHLVTGDTTVVSVGGGSHSNRSMRIAGTLMVEACEDLRAQAAAILAGAPDDDSTVHRSAPSMFAAARIAGGEGLVAEKDFFGRIPAHPTGAAVCEVEIDPATGATSVCAYSQVDDVGQAINPMIVEGQTHGGIAQGLAQALFEGVEFDPQTGSPMGTSFMQYALPHAHQLPALNIELVEDPTSGNPLRVKGGGEGGVTPSPAAAVNAICDALRAYQIEDLDMPVTPAKIWHALHAQR
jgi:aerobic carbon-monoxide dehydrogenase large subunit